MDFSGIKDSPPPSEHEDAEKPKNADTSDDAIDFGL